MTAVFKYPIHLGSNTIHRVPEGAQFVHFGTDETIPAAMPRTSPSGLMVWAVVDMTQQANLEVEFAIYETGIPASPGFEYVGTHIDADGTARHLFVTRTGVIVDVEEEDE